MESNFITIRVADTVFSIAPSFTRSIRMCKDYFCDGVPSFHIHCTYDDYDCEKAIYEKEYCRTAPGDIQLESFSILHQAADNLIDFNAILIHGAAVAVGGSAYIFSADSGIGKTTHIQKWLANIPDAFVINGDKPFLKFRCDGSSPFVCGSPWAGKERMQTNAMVPLKSIIFLNRAEDNSIEQISFSQAFPSLLSQIYRPDDEDKMRKTLRLIKQLSTTVTFWRFQCNNYKDDCFDIAYNVLVK